LKKRHYISTLLTPRIRCKFHRDDFFYIARRTLFEKSSPGSPLAQGSGPEAAINEASDED